MIAGKPLDLRLFDGAAAGAEGGAEGSNESLANSQADQSKPEVIYGKTEGRVANDNGDSTADAEAKFNELIKGEYKEIYEQKVQEAVQRRFRGQQDMENRLNLADDFIGRLSSIYGVSDPSDYDALMDAITEGGSLEEAAAEEGLTVEQYKHIKQLEAEKAQQEAAQNRLEQQQRAEETYNNWMQEAEELKDLYPSFDLEAELDAESGQRFARLLEQDFSMKDAYEAVHLQEIMQNTAQHAAERTRKTVTDTIAAQGRRPSENGLGTKAGVIVKNDPSKWTNEDIDAVIKRVRRGETIKL